MRELESSVSDSVSGHDLLAAIVLISRLAKSNGRSEYSYIRRPEVPDYSYFHRSRLNYEENLTDPVYNGPHELPYIGREDVEDFFGPPEQEGFYPPIFRGYFGSGSSSISGGRRSGPIGGLDGFGAGFQGPVGGIGGTIVGYNSGDGQGGPLGGLYMVRQGQAGWGYGGFGGGNYFPGGDFTGYGQW